MEKIRRNERMSAMMKILSDAPGKMFTLSYFCEMFGAAKSTISEDIDALRQAAKTFDLGAVETITGAAGGVAYRPRMSRQAARTYIEGLCRKLSGTERLLPGDRQPDGPDPCDGIRPDETGFCVNNGNQGNPCGICNGQCAGDSAGHCQAFLQGL